MRKITPYLIAFLAGFTLYPLLEIAFRGYTHPSMAFLGGICLCAILWIHRALGPRRLALKAILCATVITQLEFICGVIVNLYLKLAVWDYSARPFHLAGQVCPLFSFFWFLLSLAVLFLLSFGKESRQRKLQK